ncbi:MAG: alpha/beta hydrolase-fold protein [Tenuifilaceae bacterium]|nr:alpha/beta hydrolase-fold protein [Tenuifilaceae bacterium]MDX9846244.1 alpha/beta hydrolase-fold protein [Tenuifilaceae bacterium]
MTRTIIIFIFACFSFFYSFGQVTNEPIIIGQKMFIKSGILNENREYWVYLPTDYDNSKYDYPVFYLLDGQEHFHQVSGLVNHMSRLVQRMPRMIVVGIISTERDRIRDYTPNKIEILPNGGGADKFIQFLLKELIPNINNQFRTNDYKVLFGHSLAGVCVNHIFTTQTNLFNAYFAADPANFVDSTISKKLEHYIATQDTIQSGYFLSVSGDVDSSTIVPNFKLYEFIKSNHSDKLYWDFKFYPNEDHISMTLRAIYDGLESLFPNYKIPTSYLHSFDKGVIINHIEKIKNRYKIHIALPEQLINEYAMFFCSKQKYDDALELLKLNLSNYKNPYETYYFIGDVYLMKGEIDKALLNFEKSLEIKEFWDVKEKIKRIKNE